MSIIILGKACVVCTLIMPCVLKPMQVCVPAICVNAACAHQVLLTTIFVLVIMINKEEL